MSNGGFADYLDNRGSFESEEVQHAFSAAAQAVLPQFDKITTGQSPSTRSGCPPIRSASAAAAGHAGGHGPDRRRAHRRNYDQRGRSGDSKPTKGKSREGG
ncbi:hypothetical protein [Limimaricola soesokkakensis]|uniref:hypothetical protein n=1 Tax=Limimaricola soesokkakensis TaxID=1343159 RepID=UPI00355A4D15